MQLMYLGELRGKGKLDDVRVQKACRRAKELHADGLAGSHEGT